MKYGNNRTHELARVAIVTGQGRTDPFTVAEIKAFVKKAESEGVEILVFPEMAALPKSSIDYLLRLDMASRSFGGLIVAAVPLSINDCVFNCAVAVRRGRFIGAVPEMNKDYGIVSGVHKIDILGDEVPFGPDLQFNAPQIARAVIAVEVGNDFRTPITPGTFSAVHGANIIINLASLAANNEVTRDGELAKQLSAQLICCYLHAAADGVSSAIFENGSTVVEQRSISEVQSLLIADIDFQKCILERIQIGSFSDTRMYLPSKDRQNYRTIALDFGRGEADFKVGAAVPNVRVADPQFNAEEATRIMVEAERQRVDVLVYPELNLESYTASDLLRQQQLIEGTLSGLERIRRASHFFNGLAFVGAALVVGDALYNCAVVICQGKYVGVIPKSYVPNYREFYEKRQIQPAFIAFSTEIELNGVTVPFGSRLLFQSNLFSELVVAGEICEDLWVPIPPSCYHALAGASAIVNLSASNALVDKDIYRRNIVLEQSRRLRCVYAYTSCGWKECTTDMVMSGHAMIAYNGGMLVENNELENLGVMLVATISKDLLRSSNQARATYLAEARNRLALMPESYRIVKFQLRALANTDLVRKVNAYPFIPSDPAHLDRRCAKIFRIQVLGLARRLTQLGTNPNVTIGVSGGLDSAHALLVTVAAFDELGLPRKNIIAQTLPGFGTTSQTYDNALVLMQQLGVTIKEIDIREQCFIEMKKMGHKPFGIDLSTMSFLRFIKVLKTVKPGSQDLVFENVQARVRTNILMNTAFVVGTGDLSEIALGWSTYIADQQSMYNVNAALPKTLIKFLVTWNAGTTFVGSNQVLLAIVATAISPQLLPANGEVIEQRTEDIIGPYPLHDFILYNVIRVGYTMEKVLYLAQFAQFAEGFSMETVEWTAGVFARRFFASEYKRVNMAGGPKVGNMSLGQRADWRGADGAVPDLWLQWQVQAAPVA